MMKRFAILLLGLFVLGACQTPGGGRGSHTLVIMGEDSDPGSIARNDRVHVRVLNEFASQLSDYGFDVFDETAVTLDTHRQGRIRRPDAELIDVARGVRRPPIDTIALFTIYVAKPDVGYTRKVRLRIVGRLLSVHDGRRLGNFEVFETGNVRPGCRGDCLAEEVGDIARVLGREVADILGEKLGARFAYRPTPRLRPISDNGLVRGISLIFEDFTPIQMQDIEDYLVVFSGYRSHRPSATFHRHNEIWYQSSIRHAKLLRNLERMFEEIDVRARIQFSGNEYRIRNVRLPNRARRRAPRYRW